MNKTIVKFKFLDGLYRFWKYSLDSFEYDHNELLLDEIYFEFTTKDEELVNAIKSNQDKEIEVESYIDNKVTTYILMNYNVNSITFTRESWNAPYVYTIKISSNSISNVYCKDNESKNKGENNMKKAINLILDEARRRDAGILTPKIENIYANRDKRTIVIKWQDNTFTKVTCDPKDTWDIEKGIAMAIAKKALGNNYNAYTIIDKYIKSVKYTDSEKPIKKNKKTNK